MRWMIALLAAVSMAANAKAHEIGTTKVLVTLHDRDGYLVEVATDAAALAEKLEALTGRAAEDSKPETLQKYFQVNDAVIRGRLRMEWGGAMQRGTAGYQAEYQVEPPDDELSASAAIIRLRGSLPEGAASLRWSFGWTFASYSLALRPDVSAEPLRVWVEGNAPSETIAFARLAAPATRWETARRYVILGFTHIVPLGLDHMLFVLGIYLLSARVRSVLLQVSAFTVAHSITLGLSLYGWLRVPPAVVEPLIAVSIVYVAFENLFLSELRSWRVALVFAFGLLHGMGFAGVLQELGLPPKQFLTALVSFNVGVEAGQLAVIAAAFLSVGWHCAQRSWYRQRVVVPASAAIALTAVYWTVERLS